MNYRPFLAFAIGFLLPLSAATAALSGHSSAVCGGTLLTIEELEKSIREGYAPTDFSPLSFTEPNLSAFSKYLDRFPKKAAAEAQEKIATFRARASLPNVRTTTFLFSGEGVEQFLKTSSAHAEEISAQARKNSIFNPLVIAAFGTRSIFSLAAIPKLLSMAPDKAWYTIPAALIGIQFGEPVMRALLALKKSLFEKFVRSEFERLGSVMKAGELNVLSIRGRRTSDFRTALTLEENRRAPFAQEMIFDARPFGLTQLKRVARRKNPFVIPRNTIQVDFIAMPYGESGQRQILVLTAEGI